jgi:hypothetical protein
VNGVEADLVDDHPVGERLVPGVDGQGAVLLVLGSISRISFGR